jgi:hypothetical protein
MTSEGSSVTTSTRPEAVPFRGPILSLTVGATRGPANKTRNTYAKVFNPTKKLAFLYVIK